MFPWQVFGLTGSTYLPDFPGNMPSVCWLSYLFTAAGQFRTFTGIPFSPSLQRDRGVSSLYLEQRSNAILHIVNILQNTHGRQEQWGSSKLEDRSRSIVQ
jgi:hypothetical protein